MKISVENYRGIKSAALPVEGIVLVTAPNAAGKSALAQAAGAVLSGQPMPLPGVPKMLAGILVRGGEAKGFAQLTCDDSTARVDWPKAAYKTKGEPPQISAIAAGIELLTPQHGVPDDSARQKRRAELLIEILDAHPKVENLRAWLAREGINEETARAVWDTIEKQGWPAAHTQAKETGARLKGQWEAVTGENYGSKKADNFTPNDWEPELAGSSEEALQAAVTDARDTLDSMIAVAAVDDAERERLQELADALPARDQALEDVKATFDQANKAKADAEDALSKLRNPDAVRLHECPHCKGSLSVIGGNVVAGTPVAPEESEAWNAANGTLSHARQSVQDTTNQLQAATRLCIEASAAAEQLEKLSNGNASNDQVNAARQSLQLAQCRLAAFTKKTRADRLQSSILQNISIASALDTSGVRQEVVSEKINTFLIESVNHLADLAGWSSVEIAADMSLSYGGRSWAVLSESERYRVRSLFQVAVAVRESAAAVVLDAADILDKAGRNGLMSLLLSTGIPSIVCMTFPASSNVPDLRAAGIGESYWICDGVLKPLREAMGV